MRTDSFRGAIADASAAIRMFFALLREFVGSVGRGTDFGTPSGSIGVPAAMVLASAVIGIALAISSSHEPVVLFRLIVSGTVFSLLRYVAKSHQEKLALKRAAGGLSPGQVLQNEGAAFRAWFVRHNLLVTTCGLFMMLLTWWTFGPGTVALMFMAAFLACSVAGVFGSLLGARGNLLALCWRAPCPIPTLAGIRTCLREIGSVLTLRGRFELAMHIDWLVTRGRTHSAAMVLQERAGIDGQQILVRFVDAATLNREMPVLDSRERVGRLFALIPLFVLALLLAVVPVMWLAGGVPLPPLFEASGISDVIDGINELTQPDKPVGQIASGRQSGSGAPGSAGSETTRKGSSSKDSAAGGNDGGSSGSGGSQSAGASDAAGNSGNQSSGNQGNAAGDAKASDTADGSGGRQSGPGGTDGRSSNDPSSGSSGSGQAGNGASGSAQSPNGSAGTRGSGSGTGRGTGSGTDAGTGQSSGAGNAAGGRGAGAGSGAGSGRGAGTGSGTGAGNGSGVGTGSGNSAGTGSGTGAGNGSGRGSGSGTGPGSGAGAGNGAGAAAGSSAGSTRGSGQGKGGYATTGGAGGYGTSGSAPQRSSAPVAPPPLPRNPGAVVEVPLPPFAHSSRNEGERTDSTPPTTPSENGRDPTYSPQSRGARQGNEPRPQDPEQRWPNWVYQLLHR
jgi:hypothetical protein